MPPVGACYNTRRWPKMSRRNASSKLMRSRVCIKASLGAWLHTMAARRCIDRIKRVSRRRRRETRFAEARGESLDADVAASEVLAYVDEAIVRLPDKYRTVVVGRFLEGQANTVLAQHLGVAEATVRYRVNKGVDRIRQNLKDRGVALGMTAVSTALAKTSDAAPTALTARLCKLAVSGAVPAVGGTGLSVAFMMKLMAALLVVTTIGVGLWVSSRQGDQNTAANNAASRTATDSGVEIPAPTSTAANGATVAASATPTASPTAPQPTQLLAGSAVAEEEVETDPDAFSIQGRVYDLETGAGVSDVHMGVSPSGGRKIP